MAVMGRHGALSAHDALRAGFVTEVTTASALQETALDYAARINRNSPAAVEQMLRTLWSAQSLPSAQALVLAGEAQAGWRGHLDAMEGTAAFIERREPQWIEPSGQPPR
jgi:enoyl-CoA hydratase/carnithine racemase